MAGHGGDPAENFHLALLASEAAPAVNDLASLLAKAMERPWVMGTRRPAGSSPGQSAVEELIPHLKQLKIEVETQEELPLWEDAADEYVRKLRASWIGRDVPIITVPQEFDEAFPALVRWVKTQGRIEIGVEGQQGFVVRALADGGMVFEGKTGKSMCEALTALQRRIAQGIGPSGKRGSRLLLHNTNHPEAVEADRRGPWPKHKQSECPPTSAAERRLILGTARDDEIAERLDKIDPREEPAYGYRFDTPDRVVVISGDTRPAPALAAAARGADVLVHEVYLRPRRQPERRPGGDDWPRYMREFHTSDRELAVIAGRAQPKLLVLTHIIRYGATDSTLVASIHAAGYGGRVAVGHDLDRY